KAGRGLRSAG
ncbi:putative RhsG core protein with extension, partial [Escherichia coli FRIK2001]